MPLQHCLGLMFLSVIIFSAGLNIVLCKKSKLAKGLGIIILLIGIIGVVIAYLNIPGIPSA